MDLVGNCHSDSQKKVQLILSLSKKKKGDEVRDKDNDGVVRTSAPQDRVTATLSTNSQDRFQAIKLKVIFIFLNFMTTWEFWHPYTILLALNTYFNGQK
jgi:hypothetical protein